MERLTSAEVRVDASVDGMIGPLIDLTNLKPKLLICTRKRATAGISPT